MANEKNLKPFDKTQSREEAKKNGQKGGIASGKACLAKTTAREYAIAALEGVIKDKDGKPSQQTKIQCHISAIFNVFTRNLPSNICYEI